METRKELDQEDFTSYIINELSTLEHTRAERFLERYWKTDAYRALKEKLIEQSDALSPDELICFVLARDGEEAPYEIPLSRLKQVIAEKKDVLPNDTLRHLIIIEKLLAQERNNEGQITKELRDLLARRGNERPDDKASFLNLAKVNLANISFLSVPMPGAYLVRANLQHIRYFGHDHCNMSHADLRGAYAGGVWLRNANLHMSNLEGAQLECLELTNVNLSHANLTHVNLKYAKLCDVNLCMTVLNKTDMTGVDFKKTLFFNQANTIESLEAEFIQIMNKIANCLTEQDSHNYKMDYGSKSNDKLYMAVAQDLVEKLNAMNDVSYGDKKNF